MSSEMSKSPTKRDHSGNRKTVLVNGLPTDNNEEFPHTAKVYKREPAHRVFVNRSLNMEKIKIFGFDMDYTLAVYKAPEYEAMGFDMLKDRLIFIGYPKVIQYFEYDASFPCRGLWFDKTYGNLLKIDAYALDFTTAACRMKVGLRKGNQEIEALYPNKFVQLDENRLYVLNTLFNLPETYMIACLIDYFTTSKDYIRSKEGVRSGDLYMSFKSIFQDVRSAVDWVHFHGNLKKETVKNPDKFVHKDKRLAVFLNRIRENGAKTMIITNSEYDYTNKIMTYLLDFPEYSGKDWTSFFDFVVVDAKKPLFFKDGTILRKVDRETGALSLGHHVGPLQQGCVYSGGSSDVLSDMIGAKGKDVLYVGDHIFGDILRSKKEKCWRTFLVVPELSQELHVWTEQRSLFSRIESLEYQLGEIYKHLDSSAKEKPDIGPLQRSMMETVHELDLSYGMLGSLFRSGSRLTFFSAQMMRYADIYAASLLNLLHYPFSYMFRAPAMLMPHESTVKHENKLFLDEAQKMLSRQRSTISAQESDEAFQNKLVPHLRADTPLRVTHHHDDDDFEETSSTGSEKSSP